VSLYLKQGDLAPKLIGDLNADVNGATVVAKLRRVHTTTTMSKTCSITDATNGIVEYQWIAGDTDVPGSYIVEFLVTFSGSIPERYPQRSYRELSILPKVG
jgi:hypothetical protein